MYSETAEEIRRLTEIKPDRIKELKKRADALLWELEGLMLDWSDNNIPYRSRYLNRGTSLKIKALTDECGYIVPQAQKAIIGLNYIFRCQALLFGSDVSEEEENEWKLEDLKDE